MNDEIEFYRQNPIAFINDFCTDPETGKITEPTLSHVRTMIALSTPKQLRGKPVIQSVPFLRDYHRFYDSYIDKTRAFAMLRTPDFELRSFGRAVVNVIDNTRYFIDDTLKVRIFESPFYRSWE